MLLWVEGGREVMPLTALQAIIVGLLFEIALKIHSNRTTTDLLVAMGDHDWGNSDIDFDEHVSVGRSLHSIDPAWHSLPRKAHTFPRAFTSLQRVCADALSSPTTRQG